MVFQFKCRKIALRAIFKQVVKTVGHSYRINSIIDDTFRAIRDIIYHKACSSTIMQNHCLQECSF